MAPTQAQIDQMLEDVRVNTKHISGPRTRPKISGPTIQSTPGFALQDEISIVSQAMEQLSGKDMPSSTMADTIRSTTALKSELLQDPSYMAALISNKCKVCHNLDPRGHPSAYTFKIDGKILSTVELQFINSIAKVVGKNHCGYCQMIKKTVQKFFPLWEYFKDDFAPELPTLTTITLTENQPALLTIRHWVDKRSRFTTIEVFKDGGSKISSLPVLGTAKPIANNARSDQAFEFIFQCLETCTNSRGSHECCQRQGNIIPTRLVQIDWDVSDTAAFQEGKIVWRVAYPAEGESRRYAALSHCWGKEPLPKLEKATHETPGNMHERFRWSSTGTLPQTFQDGMLVALRLNVDFIWIDSLCIIQNCDRDWANEAAKMGDYYQNAFITIAAASSEAGGTSFLCPRPMDFQPIDIPFYGPRKKSIFRRLVSSNTSSTLKAKRSSRQVRTDNTRDQTVSWARTQPSNSKIPGPLATRGWALQEHILSTRIIHFTSEGIRWECRTCNKSEDGRVCLPGSLQAWNQFEKNSLHKRQELQNFWRQILIDYTTRGLTYRKDVLIALSGVAERMHRICRRPYLAGLWQDRLIEDLCWTAVIGDEGEAPWSALTHYDDIELPTWSWISVRSAINYPVVDEKGVFTPHSFLLGHDCVRDLNDPNVFGRVLSGGIVIAGPVIECELMCTGQVDRYTTQFNNLSGAIHSVISPDALLVEDDATGLLGLATFKTLRRMRGSIPYVLETTKYVKAKVYCMHLGSWKPEEQPFSLSGIDHEFVLVLARSSRVPDSFERIGMVRSDQVFESSFAQAMTLPLKIV